VGANYTGRFAPSPTGPLHAGSLVAALASWLDARAHGGQWLVRIEDVDTPRCVPGADQEILRQLAACGLVPDAPPMYQSARSSAYQAALDNLVAQKLAYPCGCSRKDIEAAWLATGSPKPRHGELVYPGTCRHGMHGKNAASYRLRTDITYKEYASQAVNTAQPAIELIADKKLVTASTVHWQDRRLGPQQQNVAQQVGDFVLRRADSLWAYQLAVVVDDAAQGITHIVRGEDLADNTARQILLQRALGYATPQYLHTPLVLAADGQKLSKQNGAQALDTQHPSRCLRQAAAVLALDVQNSQNNELLTACLAHWQLKYAHRHKA
jgi:glutamyl-Q tRNA(Asp) synthetase